jgi:predicted DNA-binding transcriptional regulator YafY
MNRTDRLLAVLLEFQARRELRAEDLARRFEVSVRTIYRDVQALTESGVPIAALPGVGYRLLDGFFLPPLALTADEALVLHLGGAFVRDRVDAELRRAADAALGKLTAILPAERQAEVERRRRQLLFATLERGADEGLLNTLRRAIERRRVVHLRYHAPRRPAPEGREVEPVSLVHFDGRWHLAAYCRLRQAPRLFRLDRIDRCAPLAERFEYAERHQIEPERAPPGAPVEATVRFDPEVARWVRERQHHSCRREEADSAGLTCVYAVRDEDDLVAWLLSWGRSFEVLAPAALRSRLAGEAEDIRGRHDRVATTNS